MQRMIASAAVAALSVGGFLLVSPASASAAPEKPRPTDEVGVMHAPCGRTAPDRDNGPWNRTGGGANMRSGSSTSCDITGRARAGDRLDYHCYTWGNDGYSWTYLRNHTDDSRSGWVRDHLLADNGSYVSCNF